MKKTTEKDYQQRILKVLLYIQNNIDADIDLDQLSSIACFSPFHFHRIFKGMIGESIGEHIRRLKLERSLVLLKKMKQPVLDLALNAGFETHEAYSRAFKKMFGLSPSDVRTALKNFPIINVAKYDLDYILRIEKLKSTGDQIMKEVIIKKIEPINVAFIRHTGPYMEVGPTMKKIIMWAVLKGIDLSIANVIGIAHDNPSVTPEDKLRFDACVSIEKMIKPEGEIGAQIIPGGEYAVVVHKGPYEEIADVFNWLYGVWLPKSGREAADASCFEIYKNSPQDTAPENLITEIYLPLAE